MIKSNEDVIDRRLRVSWRENRVRNEVRSINEYWSDADGVRMQYYARGGNYVQLHRDIIEWDPTEGDRLELRVRGNQWMDISKYADGEGDDPEGSPRGHPMFWVDYRQGRVFIRSWRFQTPYNAVRVSYRWGLVNEDVPASITRLCALMTASQVISMSVFSIKVGQGGDISGVRQDLQRAWQDEMNGIWSSWQRAGSVHSVLG